MPDENKAVAPLARIATRIAEAIGTGDIVYVAADERDAEAIAAAVAAITTDTIVHVPSSDALPGDDAPASPSNAGRRAAALRRLHIAACEAHRQPLACIVSAEATARLYPPPESFSAAPPLLSPGEPIDVAALSEHLFSIGYFNDDRIDEPGEIAVRGEVIDLFPADAELPVRIEIADGQVASLRTYDPMSQRTVAELARVEVGRAAEPPVGEGTCLLAHLKPGRIIFDPKAHSRRDRFLALAAEAVRLGARASMAVSEDRWNAALKGWDTLDWSEDDSESVPRFVERSAPWAAFLRFARKALAAGARLVIAGGARDLRFIRRRLALDFGVEVHSLSTWAEAQALDPGAVATLHMPIMTGFSRPGMLLVASADLLGSRAVLDADTATRSIDMLGDMTDLRIGDVVVHEDHGIARLAGLEPMPSGNGGENGDAIILEHADKARRLVPVEAADRLWRYGADADAVALDKLDGSSWQKRRSAIDAAIAESATALAALAKQRAALTAPVFAPDPASYERFASGFPFTETSDQARAISAVRDDLASGKPMDRLVIGDVGYGKTEVALRAAAIVALGGGQVAVAAPTTVLVRQHLESFRRRFAGTDVVVAGLSRLSSPAEKKAVKAGLADGSIHIVIGTGAVRGRDVAYRSLGLVVIDEEQRFGTADKAKLRGDGSIHVLTLSATPIPRTLQTALIGLQQLSIIATPPSRRQPIRTTVDRFDETRVRIALMREKARGGQSFVVAPRIEDLAGLAERLGRITPELRIVQAHGKMPAADLDEAMVRFADGQGDVLLATNIIEAGLDVPRANTMIVWRADRFGLAQLHQLRGRVGRGSRRGQILLVTDGEHEIGDRTLQRLRTLEAFDRLGAGFAISARDLDMRGAGDLIGDAQAGHMKLIGVALYQHLLESALRQARGETVERWSPELHLSLSGRLPDEWIPEPEIRVALYARLARIEDGAALDALEEELEDRFGALPPDAEALIAVVRIGCLARSARLARIDAGPGGIALTPRRDFAGDPDGLGLVAKNDRLILQERIEDEHARLHRVREVLEAMV
ncbi:TRCF domain-containing protein [Sphingomonas crusticola]|uniref:TRCF domain-containing protein n=1 Tax=Sphingomonas crusticola TaxID=1697973 RepID=UPI000E23844F|nr:TRCF domain-containing protein [Sphingomonas crusticola]